MPKVRVNWGRSEDGKASALFCVHNTNHKPLYCLARNASEPMSVAYSANHIYDPTPKMALDYGRHAQAVFRRPESISIAAWSKLDEARNGGLRGTVHCDDDSCFVGDEEIGE